MEVPDIDLAVEGDAKGVSRRQAFIRKDSKGWWIDNVSSCSYRCDTDVCEDRSVEEAYTSTDTRCLREARASCRVVVCL
eukprot:760806-Hanusia_phi.AAC.2